jgi:coenzyme F420-reducing hydrogenase gamma subunit
MVSKGSPCLGPVVQAGCGAICPSYNRGCYGCFGPKETPNVFSLADYFAKMGLKSSEIVRVLRNFNAYSEPFRKGSEAYER